MIEKSSKEYLEMSQKIKNLCVKIWHNNVQHYYIWQELSSANMDFKNVIK